MSLPVSVAGSQATQPMVVSLPQMQRIIQDIVGCIDQLKEDFTSSKSPITDDSQVLQRLCAKLEYLLQHEMKERYTIMGKRKDYWDYFCDCLASNKGANDGIKYVKALGEHKTSVGKGRAFIRFAMVHQRLADSLQQCIIHPKTGDWYNPASLWMQPKISSAIIANLYDLNDLHFDLAPRGYDLDNAWPSFARGTSGAGNWNVPISRRSSITSMDTLSIVSSDPSEISRLQQELASAETARSALAESVTSLEQERQRAEKSVWMTHGELSAMQEQLKSTAAKSEELRQQHSELQKSHSQLQMEKVEKEEELLRRSSELDTKHHQLDLEKERLAQQEAELAQQQADERAQSSADMETLQQKLNEVTEARDKMATRAASLEQNEQQMRTWDEKKDQQISRLEQQLANLDQRNKELTDELGKNLSSREHEASAQLESAQKLQDLLSKMKNVEAENTQLQGTTTDLQRKCEALEGSLAEGRAKIDNLQSQLLAQTQLAESVSSELKSATNELDKERTLLKETVEKLQSDLKLSREECDRITTELDTKDRTLSETGKRQESLSAFASHLMQVVLENAGDVTVTSPDVSSASETEMTGFVDVCQKSVRERLSGLQSNLEGATKREAALNSEREVLQQAVNTIIVTLPDKPECSSMDLSQKTREVETRVQSLCTQLSDMSTDNSFLKEQIQLAQGEHSDKGKQLSHLEGRLSELEKMLKESRSSESSLQGQVASLETMLKSAENQQQDQRSQLEAAATTATSHAASLEQLKMEKTALDTLSKSLEKQVADQKATEERLRGEAEQSCQKLDSLNTKVQELETALEDTRHQLDHRTQQLTIAQKKLKEGEETVEKFLASMASLETDKASISTEQDSLKQQLADAATQLHEATKEKQEEQVAKEEAQKEVSKLTQELSELTDSLETKESEVKSLQNLLKEKEQRHEEDQTELSARLEAALADSSQMKDELNQASDRLSDLESKKEAAEAETKSTAQKLEELQAKEVSLSEQVQDMRTQLESQLTEKEELRKTASSSQEESTKLLTDKQSLVASLQQEKGDLEKQVKDLLHKTETLEAQVKKAQDKSEELKQTHAQDKEETAKKVQEAQSQMQADIDSLRHQNTDLSTQLDNLNSNLNRKSQELEETQAQVHLETERLRSNSEAEKNELEDSLEKLQSRFSELQTAMDAVLKEKEDLTSLQETLQEEILELKADLASSSDSYSFMLQSSQKVYEEKDAQIETLTAQLADLEKTKTDLDSKLESASSQHSSAEERLQSLESSEQEWRGKATDREHQVTQLSQEVEELKGQVEKLTSSVSSLEQKDSISQKTIEQLELSLQGKENSYTTQVESLQQELSALQFQLSAEQLQYEESLRAAGDNETSIAEMSSRLVEQETLITELETELSSCRVDHETERTNQNQQLDELKSLVKAKETECRQLAEKLQRTSDKLEESLSSSELYQKEIGALRKSLDRDIGEREEEIQTLRSDNDMLKKQLVKAIREKAVLWEQTDSLAYEHKRKSEGKWLDNSTVNKCMSCGSDFSLFLRKHHCRLCGKIFCYNCSDHWVDSASSSKKARACTQCYTDLQNLDASVSKASLLPNDSDDEESCGSNDRSSLQGSQAESRSLSSPVQPPSSDAGLDNDGADNGSLSPASSGENIYDRKTGPSPDLPDLTSTPKPSCGAGASDTSLSESASQEGAFQVITQEEVTKSIAAYDDSGCNPTSLIDVPNMSSSMLLAAEDLASGEINKQSETWVKPGHSFAVPIVIHGTSTVSWEFTVHPKDIEFSIRYNRDKEEAVSKGELVVAPMRCNSVKEPVRGELTAKEAGVYTLVFDNSYSRMTSKKIHYTLKYDM